MSQRLHWTRVQWTLVAVLTLTLLLSSSMAHAAAFCATRLGTFQTHASNMPRFGTPLVSGPDGAAYACFITPALQTVVAKYLPTSQRWTEPTVLDGQTHVDAYHTQCSLGIDAHGYLHAAYNMHNTPWQYAVSAKPHDVSVMVFHGQDAGTPPSRDNASGTCTGACAAAFTQNEPGISRIPGNQITYPHFGTTADGTLYVAYRECLLCDQSFYARQWSLGLARYHLASRSWSRVAGIRPFATFPEKLAAGVSLYGDLQGRVHIGFLWCNRYTAAEAGQGCFAYPNFITAARSSDAGDTWQTNAGQALALPLRPDVADVVSGPQWFDQAQAPGYYGGQTSLTVDTQAQVTVVVFPHTPTSAAGITRAYVTQREGGWTPPKGLSYAPSVTYRDGMGRWIAVSSGMRIHVSRDQGVTWTLTELGLEEGPYHLALDTSWLQRTGQLRLYANNQTTGLLAIWSLVFPESGRCEP